jgi:hypothetical protein
MSTNDIVTATLVGAGIIVSIVALMINNGVDKRSIRNTLKDLAVQVNEQAAKYQLHKENDTEQFRLSLGIQVLVRQADFLMGRLRSRFSEPIAVTLAEALELIKEFWWADTYWRKATATKDRYVRATTLSYWGLALLGRGEWVHAGELAEEAVQTLQSQSTDDYIVRGDIYRAMGKWDHPRMDYWLTKAHKQYEKIPEDDHSSCFALSCAAVSGRF